MAWSKESRHARGYGSQWDKLRAVILRRDGYLCQCPECKGGELRLRPATEVDHIVQRADAKRMNWTEQQIDDPLNLRAVHPECHERITLAAQGKSRRPTPRAPGADGWPTDAP